MEPNIENAYLLLTSVGCMTDFDVIVLGGGGAGYTSAFELSRGGMKVLMLEPKGVLGGNCLYEGCCLLYTSPSPRDRQKSRMPSSA